MSTAEGTKKRRGGSSSGGSHLFDRQPPCNIEAERNTLGSILVLPQVCDDVALILKPDDFYDLAHHTLYSHILAMYEGENGSI